MSGFVGSKFRYHSSSGTKILKAAQCREDGLPTAIIANFY